MAPSFPIVQHINGPTCDSMSRELSVTSSPGADQCAVFSRSSGLSTYGQYCRIDENESDADSGIRCGHQGSSENFRNIENGFLEGQYFYSSLDLRGLWLNYMLTKHHYDMPSLDPQTIDITNDDDGDVHGRRDKEQSVPTSLVETRLLESSLNNYLKEMHVRTIKKMRGFKHAQLNAMKSGSFESDAELISSRVSASAKGSLVAAQVIECICKLVNISLKLFMLGLLQNDLMAWLHLWSSWYQVQCGASTPGMTSSNDIVTARYQSDDGVADEDEMSSDYQENYSEEGEMSSEEEYEEYSRPKKLKTNRKKRTGGHADGCCNVLLLEGTL